MNVILIAPNLSKQKGGEGMKALKIYENIKRELPETIQIVHARNYDEIVNDLKLEDIYFIYDDWVMLFLWRSIVLRFFCNVWFSHKAIKLAERIVIENQLDPNKIIIHQTEPNSPVSPRAVSKKYLNVFGPINGNIYYPKIFITKESFKAKFRRLTHRPLQYLNSIFPSGIKAADLILTAGGERTIDSLKLAGCRGEIIYETLDYGIEKKLLSRQKINHIENNFKFIQYGRLVFHKCTFLVIESLAKTKHPIEFDIVGDGPELENCKKLVTKLGLSNRVNFFPWYPSHEDLLNSLSNYRGLMFPSIEDANGMVVQEAMSLGLPAIALDWGGPQLLIDHGEDGFLINPDDRELVTDKLAEYMDTLATNPELAEDYSSSARKKSANWEWSQLTLDWISKYEQLINSYDASLG